MTDFRFLKIIPAVFIAAAALSGSCRKSSGPVAGIVTVRVETHIASGISPAAGTQFLLIDKDASVLFMYSQSETRGHGRKALFRSFRRKVEGSAVSRASADRSGSCLFPDIAPGSYWVVNLDPVRIGDERIIWAHPVTISGQDLRKKVRLQWSNAALLLETDSL
ncbi:MAG: hypothetical protein U9P14_05135 [Gemmatimonadota bacterium]|nr:hypothetical protein [Gemmatimonadota bacterium]